MVRPRHEACRLLQRHEIPSAVWFEDAIAYYGVPTVVFDIHILVPDIDKAAEALTQDRWHAAPRRETDDLYHFLQGSPMLEGPLPYLRFVPPGWNEKTDECRTVLMPADAWKVTADQLAQTSQNPDGFFPPLPDLLDALIDGWLDTPGGILEGHLGTMLAYVYGHVAQVKNQAFAEQLRPEHRHFHRDCLIGGCNMSMPWTSPFRRHQKEVRGRFREGRQETECHVDGTKSYFPVSSDPPATEKKEAAFQKQE